jgi:hypothetical protein
LSQREITPWRSTQGPLRSAPLSRPFAELSSLAVDPRGWIITQRAIVASDEAAPSDLIWILEAMGIDGSDPRGGRSWQSEELRWES